jgi:hypothetical protein
MWVWRALNSPKACIASSSRVRGEIDGRAVLVGLGQRAGVQW